MTVLDQLVAAQVGQGVPELAVLTEGVGRQGRRHREAPHLGDRLGVLPELLLVSRVLLLLMVVTGHRLLLASQPAVFADLHRGASLEVILCSACGS